jgi:hypothetical protein
MAAARAVNREAGVDYPSIERERRGLPPAPAAARTD